MYGHDLVYAADAIFLQFAFSMHCCKPQDLKSGAYHTLYPPHYCIAKYRSPLLSNWSSPIALAVGRPASLLLQNNSRAEGVSWNLWY
jgi:hypothetical protein